MTITRSLLVMAFISCTALAAFSADLPLAEISASANADGRMEIFGRGSDGRVFHRWEVTDRVEWAIWATNRDGHNIEQTAVLAQPPDGRLFSISLDAGRLMIRHQVSANGGFSDEEVSTGGDLRSFAIASNANGGVAIAAVGGDGKLYFTAQPASSGEQWDAWSAIPIGNLQVFPAPTGSPLDNFVKRQKTVGLARDSDGLLNIVALGSDGLMHWAKQETPNSRNWTVLATSTKHFEAVSAVANGSGLVSIFGLDDSGNLFVKQQHFGNTWDDWLSLFDKPVRAWTAANYRGVIDVVAQYDEYFAETRQRHPLSLATKPPTQTAEVTWDKRKETAIPFPAASVPPLQSMSMTANYLGAAGLFLVDGRGEAYAFTIQDSPDLSATWSDGEWLWLGSPTISTEVPDIVLQANLCILTPQDRAAIAKGLTATLNDQVLNVPLLSGLRNLSLASHCIQDGSDTRETLGVWLGHQPSPDQLESFGIITTTAEGKYDIALRLSRFSIDKVIDKVWNAQPKRISSASKKADSNGDIQLDKLEKLYAPPDLLRLSLSGRLWKGADGAQIPFPFTATDDAKFSVAGTTLGCAEDIDLSANASGLGIGAQFGIPFFFGLPLYDEFITWESQGEEKARSILSAQVCSLARIIPHEILIPGGLTKIVIDVRQRLVDDSGVTVFSDNSSLVPVPRAPTVLWSVVYGSAKRIDANHVQVRFRAVPTELRSPSFAWASSQGLSKLTPENTGFVGQLLTGKFWTNTNAALDGLKLGTLSVSANDLDGGTAMFSHPVVLDRFAIGERVPPTQRPPKKPIRRGSGASDQ